MKTRATSILVFLGLAACSTQTVASTQHPAPVVTVHHTAVAAERANHPLVSHTWLSFRDQRSAYLETLAAPLLQCATAKRKAKAPDCLAREGTFEVAHALTVLHRVTDSSRFGDAAELAVMAIDKSKLDTVEPYAASWFLALAMERKKATGNDDLQTHAVKVAANLESWLSDLDEHTFTQSVMFGHENNVAFALLNLWRWANHTGDAALEGRITRFTETKILAKDMDSWCPLPVDSEPEAFELFPPCLNRAVTVLAVMPDQIANPWLADFVAAQSQLEPLRHPRLQTHNNLNFSRSWALWSVYKSTGEAKYRDQYIAHVRTQMSIVEQDVAQGRPLDPGTAAFGVYALSLSY